MSKKNTTQKMASFLLVKSCKIKPEQLIEAYDNIDFYNVFQKKRQGKKSIIIKEPHKSLKFVQKRLLHFLYRLKYRSDAYNFGSHKDTWEHVAYRPVFEHLLNEKMHGQMPGKSLQTAVRAHLEKDSLFLIKMDLKNAYPSVKAKVLEKILFKILLDECKAYYFACLERLEVIEERKKIREFRKNKDAILQRVCEKVGKIPEEPQLLESSESGFVSFRKQYMDVLDWEEKTKKVLQEIGYGEILPQFGLFEVFFGKLPFFIKKSTSILAYPAAPLFPSRNFQTFRRRIFELAKEKKDIESSEITEIMKYFTQYLVRLTTFKGSLPKGSPTSGFLLNLVISESKVLSNIVGKNEICSIYVDDILITTNKKPDHNKIYDLIKKIEKSGIFKYNPKKVRVYDLRNKSGSVLGMKLVRREVNALEKSRLENGPDHLMPRGFKKAERTGRKWITLSLSLSKKKQKQYRAFLHRVITKEVSEQETSKALGYYGHIVSVYGWPIWLMPSSLAKTVQAFRDKFNITGLKK